MEYKEVCEIIRVNHPGEYLVEFNGKRIKKRLFVTKENVVCEFVPRSTKYGRPVQKDDIYEWTSLRRFNNVKDRSEAYRKLTEKYRKYAMQAQHTNPWIRKCISADVTKDPYENGMTTGCEIDGKVITLRAISKQAPVYVSQFMRVVDNHLPGGLLNMFQFRDIDCRFTARYISETEADGYYRPGDTLAYMTMYLKNGKEKTYMLINNDKLIGYDVD